MSDESLMVRLGLSWALAWEVESPSDDHMARAHTIVKTSGHPADEVDLDLSVCQFLHRELTPYLTSFTDCALGKGVAVCSPHLGAMCPL